MTATEVDALPTIDLPMVVAINQALDAALAADDTVFLLGEDIADPGGGVYKATFGLSTKHGAHRVRNTPISETAILGAAVGAAVAGLRPVAEIMIMDFLGVCLDQLTNHAAKLHYMSGGQTKVPLTVRCSAGAGMQFGAQHSSMLEAWLLHSPGLKVVVPSDAGTAKGLLTSCIFDDDPCVFIEPVMSYFSAAPVPMGDVRLPLGQAAIVRPGRDATVVAYGRQVGEALAAAERLAAEGTEVEVVDLRTIVPFDERTVLESVGRTRRLVVAHEAVVRGGVGAEVVTRVVEELGTDLAARPRRVGAPAVPVPFARELEAAYLPDSAAIEAAVRTTLEGR